jgi:hypothetical protein
MPERTGRLAKVRTMLINVAEKGCMSNILLHGCGASMSTLVLNRDHSGRLVLETRWRTDHSQRFMLLSRSVRINKRILLILVCFDRVFRVFDPTLHVLG